MDKSIPAPAAYLLDLIGSIEAPKGYDTVYANKQHLLTKPITEMTLNELIENQTGFTKYFGSSASGRYQFMRNTLLDLKKTLKLTGNQIFTPNFQDKLGYELLKRRGYMDWESGKITHDAFMIALAKEWASFPVPYAMKGAHRQLARGQSYYAGDGMNKGLISATDIWLALQKSLAMKGKTPGLPTPEIVVAAGPGGVVTTPNDMPKPPEPVLVPEGNIRKPEVVTASNGSAKGVWAALGRFFNKLAEG